MSKPNPVGYGAYLFFKPWFMKFYHWENSQRPDHKSLVPVITDKDGHVYYEFPDNMALPMCRFVKEKEYYEWMMSGISGDNLEKLTEAAKKYLLEALEKPATSSARGKDMAKVMAILEDIGDRSSKIIPFDLMINCLCALIVRDDEDPFEWNEKIHREKCQLFANEHLNYQFFFRFSHFRKLSRALHVSKDSWSEYWVKQTQETKRVIESLKIYSTGNESPKASKTT